MPCRIWYLCWNLTIDAKNDFYRFANLSIPTIVEEAGKWEGVKRDVNAPPSSTTERFLAFLKSSAFENKETEPEQQLRDELERHKDDRVDAFRLTARKLIDGLRASEQAERSLRGCLRSFTSGRAV